MGLRTRLSWMISGPARIDELDAAVRDLQQRVDALGREQDAQLAEVRASVTEVLDDVMARLAALDAAHDADRAEHRAEQHARS